MQYPWPKDFTLRESQPLSSPPIDHEWLNRDGELIDEEERFSRMTHAHNHSRAVYTGTDVSHELVYLVNDAPLIHIPQSPSEAASRAAAPQALSTDESRTCVDEVTTVSLAPPHSVGLAADWQGESVAQSSDVAPEDDSAPEVIHQAPGYAMAEIVDLPLQQAAQVDEATGGQPVPGDIDSEETRYEGMSQAASDDSQAARGQQDDELPTTLLDDDAGADASRGLSAASESQIAATSVPSPLIDELLLSAEPGLFTTAAEQETLAPSAQRFTLAELVGEQGESDWNTYSDTATCGIEMSVYSVPSVELDDMALLLAC
ncbi:hypothetical protein HQN64_05080 [Enterobacteriaceae bacterium BIT-l23]|uniref:hypothetical protein n=1 Tax=Jejubacter sp. L23 TaxID=3092086 RepID=UPI0015845285|nr:hypothetical protein [Enterobacteriaceae bacterium BIT-l23]